MAIGNNTQDVDPEWAFQLPIALMLAYLLGR
jgi:hypothetical protein